MTYEIFNENHSNRPDHRKPFPGKYKRAAAAAAPGLRDHC